MDVRGITWAANIYRKFEAMCLEVEEIMYQDTVKYVENQVQTVGASVKKLYSDVMEDLLLPSSLDPGKVSPSEFILEQFSDVEVCKKPKLVIKKENLKVDISQLRKRSKAPGSIEKSRLAVTSTQGTHSADNSSASLAPDSSEKVARSGLLVPGSFSNRTMLRGSAEPAVPSVSSGNTDYHSSEVLERTLTTSDSDQETPSACLASSDSAQNNLVGDSTYETETRNEAIPDPSMHCLPSNTSLSESELSQSNEREKDLSSSEGFTAVSQDISWDNSTVSFGASSEHEDFCSNIHEENGLSNSECGTVDCSDKAKLEESCILVNGDELQFVAVSPGKGRSYKKKICGALSSRKKGSRAQEYKQLARQFADNVNSDEECTSNLEAAPGSMKSLGSSRSHDLGESEWELL